MATATTSEIVRTVDSAQPFSMIEHKGILARLAEELSLATYEFKEDPRAFIREIFSDDAEDPQRSRRIRMGLALGLGVQLVLMGLITYFGWNHIRQKVEEKKEYEVRWVNSTTDKKPE